MDARRIANRLTVGEVVYISFSPQNPGKVIERLPPGECPPGFSETFSEQYDLFVKVRWLQTKKNRETKKREKESWMYENHVMRLATLIEDHRRKLEGHEKRMDAVTKL